MARWVQTWAIAGSLAMAALEPAAAQFRAPVALPVGIQAFAQHTGVLTSFGYQPALFPTTWIVPNYVIYYQAPQPVYGWTAPEQRATAPAQGRMVTLGGGAAVVDVRSRPGETVNWVNASNREQILVIGRHDAGGAGSSTSQRQWRVAPNGSIQLVFNRAGVYDYYSQAEPDHQAWIVVAE